jgi:mannose/cellobiose epimerase-like protein (N-acyl-D-glucosamine 2-epimerase family)
MDPNEDFAYVGHGVEVQWMLMAEAIRRGDTELYGLAAARFKHQVSVAKDPVYGGCFRGMVSVRQQQYMVDDDCKVKWVQDEVMVGCVLLMEHGTPKGDADPGWGTRTLHEFAAYCKEKFSLQARGLPYVIVGGDRQVTFRESYVNKGQPGALNRKENYHHPRALMLMLESLRRIAAAAPA